MAFAFGIRGCEMVLRQERIGGFAWDTWNISIVLPFRWALVMNRVE